MSKTTKSERTRADILDAAWTLIAARGASIPISEIAAEVGMTRQSIYVHFGSRGGLLMALVRRADERADIRGKFEAALATEDATERFRRFLTVWFSFVQHIYPVASDLIRLRPTDEDAAAAWEDRMSDLRRVIRLLLRGLKEDGLLAEDWTLTRAVDFFWAGSSVETWGLLTQDRSWSPAQAARTITHSMECTLLGNNP
ncbi:MAG: TetR/AcrR family transcriptional regulator [Parvibaculum sp.]|nr:TetR/AcrR family transcriptional regulator [Parvibaculum sp.]